MSKKPKVFKSKGLSQDSLAVEFIKSHTEVIKISAWDASVTLTPTESVRLLKWLKKAVPYIKDRYDL